MFGFAVMTGKRVRCWTLTSFRSGRHVATGSSMLQVRARTLTTFGFAVANSKAPTMLQVRGRFFVRP
ncbi:MAG: hypothetical protein ACLQVJ_26760, partial [Syntrophobacteraceae bacterium]